jgi:hypothetical protein
MEENEEKGKWQFHSQIKFTTGFAGAIVLMPVRLVINIVKRGRRH